MSESQSQGASPSGGFEPPSAEVLGAALPRFEIIEVIGRGGMGAVYKARQPELDRLVAIKVLPAEMSGDVLFAERFKREAQAMAKLQHPGILAVYEFGDSETGVPPVVP